MQYTVLPVVSHYSTDQHVAVTCQSMQQCARKDSEEEDCEPVNMNVRMSRFKVLKKLALQMFYEEGNAFNTFVRAQGYTQCVSMSKT